MGATTRQRIEKQPAPRFGAGFHTRRGTDAQPFWQRLSRARLLYLRRRETAANWLALTISVVTYFPFAAVVAGSPLRHCVVAQRVLPEKHTVVAAYRRVATERALEPRVQSSANSVMS